MKVSTRGAPPARHGHAGGAKARPARAGRRPAARRDPNAGLRTALQKHVDFFDADHDGRVTMAETYDGLRRLGLGVSRSAAFGAIINAALGSSTSGAPSLTVDIEHIHLGTHGSDSGVYDDGGRFQQKRFDDMFARYDRDRDGALDRAELGRLFAGNRRDVLGHLGSAAEFLLLLHLAGEDRGGRRVLTRERLARFYDGSLFYRLADDVAARRPPAAGSLVQVLGNGLRLLY